VILAEHLSALQASDALEALCSEFFASVLCWGRCGGPREKSKRERGQGLWKMIVKIDRFLPTQHEHTPLYFTFYVLSTSVNAVPLPSLSFLLVFKTSNFNVVGHGEHTKIARGLFQGVVNVFGGRGQLSIYGRPKSLTKETGQFISRKRGPRRFGRTIHAKWIHNFTRWMNMTAVT
jgi:hypothetical protein